MSNERSIRPTKSISRPHIGTSPKLGVRCIKLRGGSSHQSAGNSVDKDLWPPFRVHLIPTTTLEKYQSCWLGSPTLIYKTLLTCCSSVLLGKSIHLVYFVNLLLRLHQVYRNVPFHRATIQSCTQTIAMQSSIRLFCLLNSSCNAMLSTS